MKTKWYARDTHTYAGTVFIFRDPPVEVEGIFRGRVIVGFPSREFKKLFGFTPRPGEKGQLEIRRIKKRGGK